MNKKGLWINPTQFVEFAGINKKSSLANMIATRDKSIDFTSLLGYLPNPDYVLKRLGRDQDIYEEIKADGKVSSSITNRKAGTLALKHAINRGKAKTEISGFIEDIIDNLDMVKIIQEILDAPLHGFKPMEISWKHINSKWVPVDLVGKPPRWFIFDSDGQLCMKTRLNLVGELMPQNKFIVPKNDATYENPYGDALLSKCFWPVTFKKAGLKFWVVLAEKFGIPHLVGKHQPGASSEEIDALLDAMETMIQDAVAAIPNNASIETLESSTKTASVDLYKALIDECKSEISLVLLGQTLTTEIGSTGSYAAAQVHSNIRDDIVDSDKRLVEWTINQLIKLVVELNYGPDKDRPVFELYKEEDVDKDLAERDKTLSGTGQVRFTKKYYQRYYGFEEDEILVDETFPVPGVPVQFASQQTDTDPVQSELENMLDNIEPSLQEFASDFLKPVFDVIEMSQSYDDMLSGMAKIYPHLDSSALESKLEKAMLLGETWGRLNIKDS